MALTRWLVSAHFKGLRMVKITKRTVDSSQTPGVGKRDYLWDDELKGFGLLLLPSGVKSYFYQYRTAEGTDRRITIGKHGAFTPDQARSTAEDLRQRVRSGGDPIAEKKALHAAATVAELLDSYVSSENFKSKAAKTQAIDLGRIERHLKPLLGRKYAHILTPSEVERALAGIRDGKTAVDVKTRKRGRARVRGGEGAARMSIVLLRTAFAWALRDGIVKANPCQHVRTGQSGTRDTILNDTASYARLFQTLDRMETEKRIRGPVADAIRLIALTGARRGEVAGLIWSYVDLKKGLLTLPANAHKTGRKTGRPRVIGLPAAAQAIIARQPAGNPDNFVFLPAQGQGVLSLSKPWRKVRVEADLPAGIGLHGLRHSVASHMAMGGAEAAEIKTTLGHRQLSTAQRYIHWAQDARQALAERAASVAVAGMNALQGTTKSTVVEFEPSNSKSQK